jgi:hypothetical protein
MGVREKHDPFAGIILIKLNRIISERTQLCVDRPPISSMKMVDGRL